MAGDDDFLSRWSRRKRAARAGELPKDTPPPTPAVPVPVGAVAAARDPAPEPAPLPAVEDLTPESDFTPFMDGKVDPDLRSQALKKLFSDPRYNVMDRLDTYIDDYSTPDPIPPEWLSQLTQMAGLGDVPARERAEREAREQAGREAVAATTPDPAVGPAGDNPGADADPVVMPDAETAADDDEGQVEASPARAGCGTSSIPARKVGD